VSFDVGVVIPAYNAAAFIGEALDSVAAQTRQPAQVTVVNDGSLDATSEVVRAWMKAHPDFPVNLLEIELNRGLSHTRNRAIAATQTEFIATLDADDLFLPTHLERLTEPLTREPEVILAFGDVQEFSVKGDLAETFLTRLGGALRALDAHQRDDYQVLSGPVFRSLLPGNYVPVSGMIFRRDAAVRAGLYDPGLIRVEDRDFILRIARIGRFAFCDVVVARKRIHHDNISGQRYHMLMAEGAFGVMLRAREWVKDGSDADRRPVEEELQRAAKTLLYSASVTSVSTLSRVAKELRDNGFRSLGMQPRAWLRAYWHAIAARSNRIHPD
jgi:glycosyltransferase involved in cell wall biosynthesis